MALAVPTMRSGAAKCVRVRSPAAAAPRSAVVARAAQVQKASKGLEAVTPAQACEMIKEGWKVLDVRPPGEVSRCGIEGAVEAAMYLPETRNDPASLMKRFATYSNGGWWVGATHMIPNPTWRDEVETKLPKDSRVIVACQTGVRSLSACKSLEDMGYGTVAWLQGGLEKAKAGELPTVPPGKDPRYGGIGGMSEQMGWTKVQKENGDWAFAGGVDNLLLGLATFVVLDLIAIQFGIDSYIFNLLTNGSS